MNREAEKRMASNPFTLSFGMKPTQYISRVTQTDEIIESFTAEVPSGRVFMITGVRGSGKTVMLSNLSENFQSRKVRRRAEPEARKLCSRNMISICRILFMKKYGLNYHQRKRISLAYYPEMIIPRWKM